MYRLLWLWILKMGHRVSTRLFPSCGSLSASRIFASSSSSVGSIRSHPSGGGLPLARRILGMIWWTQVDYNSRTGPNVHTTSWRNREKTVPGCLLIPTNGMRVIITVWSFDTTNRRRLICRTFDRTLMGKQRIYFVRKKSTRVDRVVSFARAPLVIRWKKKRPACSSE